MDDEALIAAGDPVRERADAMRAALEKLTATERAVILLRDYSGLPCRSRRATPRNRADARGRGTRARPIR